MTNKADEQYLAILRQLLEEGVYREGRNGGTYGLFGAQMRFDLSEGFPLLTTKRVHFRSVVAELLWFLSGSTNVRDLQAMGCTIWDEWADYEGKLGPVYGAQWRSWEVGEPYLNTPIDQISRLIRSLKEDPYSRRHVVSAWNVGDLEDMAIPPCHCLFQLHVANGKLSCHLYQRSADWFLGVPFNVASYALLTHLMAREVGLEVGDFVHSFGDLHLYANHVEQAREQLKREPKALPELGVTPELRDIFTLNPVDIWLREYHPHAAIPAPVSV